MKLAPSRLSPVFVPRIWGARTLAPLFSTPAAENAANYPAGGADPIGEVWLTGERCEFTSGDVAGRSLGSVWTTLPAEWTGRRVRGAPRIPLLVKFIFPDDKLSVQVHPNDDYAREHEALAGGMGKTEMWYAVAARHGAEVRLGFAPGVTREAFRQAIGDGTAEQCLQPLTVNPGDTFFVPAGTPHTIGPGMVLCEVQQHSDLTYRVFDYNRLTADGTPRPLHIEKALEVLQFDEHRGERTRPVQVQRGPLLKTYLAVCPYFATERWEFSESISANTSPERFELLITLLGHGRIEWRDSSAAYAPAEAWFVPAALGGYRIVPDSATTMLRTYVPDLQDLARQLAQEGIQETDRASLLHP